MELFSFLGTYLLNFFPEHDWKKSNLFRIMCPLQQLFTYLNWISSKYGYPLNMDILGGAMGIYSNWFAIYWNYDGMMANSGITL